MTTVIDKMRSLLGAIGRRGAALLFFGVLDVLIGISLLDPKSQPRGDQAQIAYHYVQGIAPYQGWGWVWIIIGGVCLGQSVMKDDRLAFALAIAIKLVWGTCFLASFVLDNAYRGWVAVSIWYSIAAFVSIIAGWPEPVFFKSSEPMKREEE